MSYLQAEITRFHDTIIGMQELLATIDEASFHQKPSAEEWSVAQIASHVEEAILFWLEDICALQVVPGAKWGRNHEHVRRLKAVADVVTEKLTPQKASELLAEIDAEVARVLPTITEEQYKATAPSYNPNFDGKPLSFIVEHLIVKHVEGHLGQMQRHLAKVQATV